jgi:hypothetical protein
MDYDMWLYPPVDWTSPDYDYELPEPIEAANIEGTLLVNADDAIEQVRHLQAENAKLRELVDAVKEFVEDTHCEDCPCRRDCDDNNRIFCVNDFSYHAFAAMRDLRIEVDG